MITLALALVVGLAAGFGAGRIKNKKKLAAIAAEIQKVTGVGADAAVLVARIRAVL